MKKRYGKYAACLGIMFMTGLICVGCAAKQTRKVEAKEMQVTSKDLVNGVWNSDITKTKHGSNRSPELSWEAVDGASEYAVYMVDEKAHNWLHWKASGITGTELAAGAKLSESDYVGPYPPSGTHTYVVYVYALLKHADHYAGKFDSMNKRMDQMEQEMDIAEGKSGNIIARGILSGTYTAGQ